MIGLDTNVLVSGMINPVGAPGRLVDMVRAGALQLGSYRVLAMPLLLWMETRARFAP